MDIASLSPVPMLIDEDRAILSKKILEEQKELEQKARRQKLLVTHDSENQTYTKYTMRLKNELSYEDINRTYWMLDQTLSSLVSGGQILLKEGKTAADLKETYNRVLYSNIFCLDEIADIYNPNIENKTLIEEPIRAFLELFDVKEVREYTQQQFEDKINDLSVKNKIKAYEALKKCVASATYNSMLINDIQKRTHSGNERTTAKSVDKQKVKK